MCKSVLQEVVRGQEGVPGQFFLLGSNAHNKNDQFHFTVSQYLNRPCTADALSITLAVCHNLKAGKRIRFHFQYDWDLLYNVICLENV